MYLVHITDPTAFQGADLKKEMKKNLKTILKIGSTRSTVSFILSIPFREWHGLPWGFSGQPVPVPVRTRTRTQGSGFETYGSWVGYNPRVSKPVWDRNARNFTCVLKKAI